MPKNRKRDDAVALGSGVFVVYKNKKPRRIAFRSLPTLRSKLGEGLLAGFVRALNAAERLSTFVHLMQLNASEVKSGAWPPFGTSELSRS